MANMPPYRQLLAYATVAIFLVFIFFYGTAESFRSPANVSSTQGLQETIDLGDPTCMSPGSLSALYLADIDIGQCTQISAITLNCAS